MQKYYWGYIVVTVIVAHVFRKPITILKISCCNYVKAKITAWPIVNWTDQGHYFWFFKWNHMIYVSAQYSKKKNALQYDAYNLVQLASRMMECSTWEVDGWGGSGGRGYPWPLSHIDTSKPPACTGRHSPPCMNMITDMFQTNSNPSQVIWSMVINTFVAKVK